MTPRRNEVHAFISYSRTDKNFARRLARDIGSLGANVWIDNQDIEPGEAWTDEIQRGLDKATVMVLILSPEAMASKYVTAEWLYFIENDKPIIPVLHQATVINFQLRPIQYVDFQTLDYTIAFQHLRKRLLGDDDTEGKRPPQTITPGNVRKLYTRKSLKSHKDSVRSIAFSPDSKLLASASDDRTVRLWHTTGRKSSRIKGIGHEKAVNTVAFSPNGTLFASGSDDRTVRVWNVEKNICIIALSGHTGPITGLAYSPAAALLASCSEDHTIRLWNVRNQTPEGILGTHDGATDVAFSPEGATLASGGMDRRVRLWAMEDPAERREVAEIETSDGVHCLAFSPDGTHIAIGLFSAGLAMINVEKCEIVETVYYADFNANCVRGVAFSPDGQLLAVGTLDGKVRLWNAERLCDGKQSRALRSLDEHEVGVTGVAFSSDGTVLASASHDSTIRLWATRK